jgi:organic radical activating enzyme
MNIHYKNITHERTEDAPFIGALICADSCKFKCRGCFNRELKKLPTIVQQADEIVKEIKANPFNEGIIFGGLEWTESPLELLELARVASKEGLKVMIYTGCTLPEFYTRLGDACKKGYAGLPQEKQMSQYIGALMLDTFVPKDYYVKTGLFDKTKMVDDNIQFGVKLASSNQKIYEIKGYEND